MKGYILFIECVYIYVLRVEKTELVHHAIPVITRGELVPILKNGAQLSGGTKSFPG